MLIKIRVSNAAEVVIESNILFTSGALLPLRPDN